GQRAGLLAKALLQHREMLVHALDVGDDAGLVLAADRAELQVLLDRQRREGAAALRHMRDAEPDDAFGGAPGERRTLEFDGAGRAHHAEDSPKSGDTGALLTDG